ncbi:MAG: hypothetical protein JXA90_09680 [Planctomycetes bacterium]|nr:hypothetical protein [Planctomycetota bacterium]
MAKLSGLYPDRDAVLESHARIRAQLVEFAAAHPLAPEAGPARALAAEAALVAGDAAGARNLWAQLAQAGPRDSDRARGLYLLGEHYFLGLLDAVGLRRLSPAAREKRRLDLSASCERYLSALVRDYPEDPRAPAARRCLAYLGRLRSAAAPAFEARLRRGDEEVVHSLETLGGKVAILYFWRARSAGVFEDQRALLDGLRKDLADYPVLEGRVEVLGILLDRDPAPLREAVERWEIPWPQLHDGQGFDTPLARLFAIPSAPHYAVIDADGRQVYLGVLRDEFLPAAAGALKALRLRLESQGGSGDPTADEEPVPADAEGSEPREKADPAADPVPADAEGSESRDEGGDLHPEARSS